MPRQSTVQLWAKIKLFGNSPRLNFWLCRWEWQFLNDILVRKSDNCQQKMCISSLRTFCQIGPLCLGFFALKCHKILMTTCYTFVLHCFSCLFSGLDLSPCPFPAFPIETAANPSNSEQSFTPQVFFFLLRVTKMGGILSIFLRYLSLS